MVACISACAWATAPESNSPVLSPVIPSYIACNPDPSLDVAEFILDAKVPPIESKIPYFGKLIIY